MLRTCFNMHHPISYHIILAAIIYSILIDTEFEGQAGGGSLTSYALFFF